MTQLHIASAHANAEMIWQGIFRLSKEKAKISTSKEQLENSPLCVALPGGSSMQTLADALPSPNSQPHAVALRIFSLDERFTPLSAPDSNMGALQRLLESKIKAGSEEQKFRFEFFPCFPQVPLPPLKQARLEYEATFENKAAGQIDVAVVGIGPDGHLASLFPAHSWQSCEADSKLLITTSSPKPPKERISFSLQTIAEAKHLWVYTFGASKADVIARSLDGEKELPLGALLQRAPHAQLYLDPAAASLIR